MSLKDNLFEWHFTIRGPADSEFDGGIYHGRIVLPPEYPMKPPSIIILTVCEVLYVYRMDQKYAALDELHSVSVPCNNLFILISF